jgi:hypothetical protein
MPVWSTNPLLGWLVVVLYCLERALLSYCKAVIYQLVKQFVQVGGRSSTPDDRTQSVIKQILPTHVEDGGASSPAGSQEGQHSTVEQASSPTPVAAANFSLGSRLFFQLGLTQQLGSVLGSGLMFMLVRYSGWFKQS